MHQATVMTNSEMTRPYKTGYILKEVMLKILIVGDYGVGKTAVIRRYTEGKFSSNYKTTIGADFSIKTIPWDSTTQVNIQLWDIAGNEKLGFMSRVYYKYAVAAIVVFDISRISTFHSLQRWLKDIREKVSLPDGLPIPIIVLANKCDIPEACLPIDALNKVCRQFNVAKWYKTSAKNNSNIEDAMLFLISCAMKNKLTETQQESENVLLQNPNPNSNESLGCCEGY